MTNAPIQNIPGFQLENVQGSRYNRIEPPKSKNDNSSSATAMHNMQDKILPSDLETKVKVKIEQATMLPEYVYRGMKGDPDYNFFEFLQVTKIPYYIGGPVLAGIFLASRNSSNLASRAAGTSTFKRIALGVALYYASAALAKAVIDVPVKMFCGIDLNHPYKDVVDLREGNPQNLPANKKKEYHKVFESVDFTRWDLLYDYKKPDNDYINRRYTKIARKYGLKGKPNDIDSTLKEKIKQTIVMATAWKYMLLAPFVMMTLGLAQQESFNKINFGEIKKSLTYLFEPLSTRGFKKLGTTMKHNLYYPIKNGVKELWKGKTLTSSILGKFAIISSLALPLIANIMILAKTSSDNSKLINLKTEKKGK